MEPQQPSKEQLIQALLRRVEHLEEQQNTDKENHKIGADKLLAWVEAAETETRLSNQKCREFESLIVSRATHGYVTGLTKGLMDDVKIETTARERLVDQLNKLCEIVGAITVGLSELEATVTEEFGNFHKNIEELRTTHAKQLERLHVDNRSCEKTAFTEDIAEVTSHGFKSIMQLCLNTPSQDQRPPAKAEKA
ncbi:hypothetical protein GQ43DRAFT_430355 [Delitschia confertaspora ATCC 74209]|uniref:Uncharacterized protein n=1 Tax=Delitschia confertaspora ATCC 74209 TaxID=1513339 RepID=A0A9P4JPA0_9PLEO|nr:hypothetical protein GQ43DRAFT_430355 [Delitschia confertaspora ATCC 74209]